MDPFLENLKIEFIFYKYKNIRKSNYNMNTENFEFQIHDWNSYHEIEDDEDKYVIQLFGRNEDDQDVCIKVVNFTPFFYVEIPDHWTNYQANSFVQVLKNKVKWFCERNPKYNYDISESLIDSTVVRKHKFYNFTNNEYFKFVMLVFKSQTAMMEFSRVLEKPLKAPWLTKDPFLYKRYESNIEPHIRFMHMTNISSCGWVSIAKNNLMDNKHYSHCDHSYSVFWRNIKPSNNNNRMASFKIMGYDIECITCDHNFPQANRKTDKIIQIGMTMYRCGTMDCEEQHILTLNNCNDIKGAIVTCYKNEKELLRGWAKKMNELRPDFKVGYNNFGFDDKYIYERIQRFDQERAKREKIPVEKLENKFTDEIMEIIGKVNNQFVMEQESLKKSLTYYKYKELSSSAMGDNKLFFIQIPGIISIDMMKVIQREHRLQGHTLDNVSANFITESIIKVVAVDTKKGMKTVNIYTGSTKALENKSYIQIMINSGYSASPLNKDEKYKVLEITSVQETVNDKIVQYQCITTKIKEQDYKELCEALKNPSFKTFWTFAKDDMHHTVMNKYFREGDPKKIRQIAKYCIKDCKLVNLLLAKLEIIINGMGMAQVCHVPLSYLFLRGQGVKIFSLISKKCREKNHLIPVLEKKKVDKNETNKKKKKNNEDKYEGAYVLDPVPNVYLSPIGVLDYSSLYPNAMREKNLSHECFVNDEKYDNMPGYIYHDIYIIQKDEKGRVKKNIDGTIQKQHYRFAQEIMTDEKIHEDLKDIINEIENNHQKNITMIQTQKYMTEENVKAIINNDVLKNDKKCKNEIKTLSMEYNDILEKKLYLQKKLNGGKINSQRMSKKIANLWRIELNIFRKKLLVRMEEMKRETQIRAEKDKKFNTVNDVTVRYGILAEILTELLNKRKETCELLKIEKDPFRKVVLNGLQLALKITANSLYGQTGAPTSDTYFLPIAASTTATGRKRLLFAKKLVEKNFEGSEIIYGDTDSIFINFHLKDEHGNEKTTKETLTETINLCKRAAKLINDNVPKPQSIVYEKTFYPFILVAKKKYVGLLYGEDPNKFYLKAMGIVLVRRDNAPIVKIVVGGIIDHILKHQDINGAIEHLNHEIVKVMNGEYAMDKFIIAKKLKSFYKNEKGTAHKVLADRMALRDPGNKPQIGDRIPFVYVVKNFGRKKKKDILQGDLIEHPAYVEENKLQIDYLYYLEHQIINPASQILNLVMSEKSVNQMFNKYIIQEESKRIKRQPMDKFVDPSKIKKKIEREPINNTFKSLTMTLKNNSKKKKWERQNMEQYMDYTKIQKKTIEEPVKSIKPATTNNSNEPKKKLKNQTMDKWLNMENPKKSKE